MEVAVYCYQNRYIDIDIDIDIDMNINTGMGPKNGSSFLYRGGGVWDPKICFYINTGEG